MELCRLYQVCLLSAFLFVAVNADNDWKLGALKPPNTIGPVNPKNQTSLPKNVTRRVLIIGGGVAGLSAALELAERGFQVTIKEAKDVLGGGLATRKVVFGIYHFQIENRFHSWYENYYQMNDIVKRLNTTSSFIPWTEVKYIYKNYKMENVKNDGNYPMNFIRLVEHSKNLKIVDVVESRIGIEDIIHFDFDKIYTTHDSLTYEQWAKASLDTRMNEVLYRPLINEMYNNASTVSAAEVLKAIHLNLISNYINKRQISNVNYGAAFVEPLVKRLTTLKVKIILKTEVKELLVDDNTAAVVGDANDEKDLYHHVILATNSDSANQIIANTLADKTGAAKVYNAFLKLSSKTQHLKRSSPYKVIRVLLKKALDPSHPTVVYTPEHTPLMLIAQYHKIEKESMAWAKKTGGAILEFHLYPADKNIPDSKLWNYTRSIAQTVFTDLAKQDALAYHVTNFTGAPDFAVDSHNFRPTATFPAACGIANFTLAGDWLAASYPAHHLELAASTGREAANEVLLLNKVRQATLTVSPSKGPGLL